MNKIKAFSERNLKEIIRDPLSYIFCLVFPLVMLIVMTVINDGITKSTQNLPPEAAAAAAVPTIFQIDKLAGGVAVFGLTFVMLFCCLSVSKDRAGAFLTRLYTTPMKSGDFILGYMLPTAVIGIIQIVITFAASFIVSLVVDNSLNPLGLLAAAAALIPTIIMMISFGLLFGSLLNDKAAPGICSVVISLASFLGGVWFDAESLGGVMLKICNILPFYHAVKSARIACSLDFTDFLPHLLITIIYAAAVTAAAAIAFKQKMRADLQ